MSKQPGLTRLTMYRCGCGSMSQFQGQCLNLSLGAHDNVAVRRYSEPVEFIAGADIAALIEWGGHAWKQVDELRAENSRLRVLTVSRSVIKDHVEALNRLAEDD